MPSREEIEKAVHLVEVRTEDVLDTRGIIINVGQLKTLALAASWALKVVDPDHPPPLDDNNKVLSKSVQRRLAATRGKPSEP